MRTRNTLLTAAVIGLAAVAGLLGVGGTWALWTVSIESDAGTVQAADFTVAINGNPIRRDGATVSIAMEDPGARLTPSTPVYTAVTVTNTTDAGGPFTVEAVPGTPSAVGGTTTDMQRHLAVRSAPLTAGTCSKISTDSYAPHTGWGPIATGDAATYCVEIALKPSAPASLGSRTFTVVLPLSVTQLPAGT